MTETPIHQDAENNDQTPEDAIRPTLTVPEDLRKVFKEMRNEGKVLNGKLPASDFPELGDTDTPLIVAPCYLNSTDPDDLGYWDITVGTAPKARIKSVPSQAGVIDLLEIEDSQATEKFRPADEKDTAYVQGLLNYLSTHSR
jgi:hypothetical protein